MFFLLLFFMGGATFKVSAQINQALNTFIQSSSLKYAGIGIKVVETDTKKVVCSYNDNLALCPASTMKTLTTATALELLGPAYRFETKIICDGEINNDGLLEGNLLIVGSGDPSLGSSYLQDEKNAFLKGWLTAIQKAGIKAITGNIISIDDLYGYEGVSNRWIWEDLGNYYASATYGISLFDNTYQLFLRSGAINTTPSVLYTEPEINGLTFENHLKTTNIASDSVYIHGMPLSNERKLYGSLPPNRNSISVKGDIPDPGLFLAQTLTNYLNTNGITIHGKSSTSRTEMITLAEKYKEIYVHQGNTLEEIIKITNFRSNNHFAEHLFYKIGWNNSQACTENVPTLAAEKIASFWKQKGIDTSGLFQYDGSGLSNANGVTASFLTSMLVYMQKQSQYADIFYQSLPLAGKEGTVKSFLKGTTLEGKARIKSGSISKVQTYTGYYNKNGKRYAFAILVNNFTGSRETLRNQMEKLLLNL